MWSDSTGLLVFPMVEGTTIIGYIGRRFSGTGSKYVIRGEKTRFTRIYGEGTSLIFTEDLISAVKVGRVQSALPLFGTHLKTLPRGYSKYYLWLDKDKQRSSVEQCRKWRQYGYNISPIITEKDPKDYTTQQIQEFIQ